MLYRLIELGDILEEHIASSFRVEEYTKKSSKRASRSKQLLNLFGSLFNPEDGDTCSSKISENF
jgi:hypothetical protein